MIGQCPSRPRRRRRGEPRERGRAEMSFMVEEAPGSRVQASAGYPASGARPRSRARSPIARPRTRAQAAGREQQGGSVASVSRPARAPSRAPRAARGGEAGAKPPPASAMRGGERDRSRRRLAPAPPRGRDGLAERGRFGAREPLARRRSADRHDAAADRSPTGCCHSLPPPWPFMPLAATSAASEAAHGSSRLASP